MSSSISLTTAVTSGDERAVASLLARGADVNETTSGGQSALILAVIFGHTNLVKLLVKAGADTQLRDNLGLNALEWAKRRGSREALEILTGVAESTVSPVVKTEKPQKPAPPAEAETKEPVDDGEKSKRWLAGLRQRLDERELRRKEAPPVEPVNAPEPPEPKKAAPPEPQKIAPPEPKKAAPAPAPPNRKRCPKCNEIYNGDLVSYCAHHVVELVDVDEPLPVEPRKSNTPLFWIMVIVTLSGSIVIGSLITAYMYNANQAAARDAAAAQQPIQKGIPELGGDLVGKALNLPEAECPVRGPEPVNGVVTVNVRVDKKGEVYWARGSGGDWLMRGASTEAAMKSTFSTEKLRGREAEGTITYTFKP